MVVVGCFETGASYTKIVEALLGKAFAENKQIVNPIKLSVCVDFITVS